MSFMFPGLYEDITDIDMYLQRIGYHGGRKPALDDLKELIRKNQTHIPYSNLDFYHKGTTDSIFSITEAKIKGHPEKTKSIWSLRKTACCILSRSK